MKLNLSIEIELTEHEEMLAKKDLLAFFSERITVNGIENADLKILSARLLNETAVTECNFPKELNKCLNSYGVYYLHDLQKLRFSQIYDIVCDIHGAYSKEEYVSFIHNTMKKYGISYNDIEPDMLIPIRECGFSSRIANCLINAGYIYLQDISRHTKNHIYQTRNFGAGSQKKLEETLQEHGLWYAEYK